MTSNEQQARNNELMTLQAIGLVGWLNASQIARWVWSESSAHSARVSADRVLKRLQKQKFVLRRESGNGVYAYVLTRAGAAYANEHLGEACFREGYDLSQLDVARQAPAVEFLMEQRRQGHKVWGMAAVRRMIEDGTLDGKSLRGADGIVMDEATDQAKAVLVVRNVHPELVKKARRLKSAFGALELIGEEWILKMLRRELKELG